MVRAARREADQLPCVRKYGGDDGDIGEVGPAGKGVVEDPRHAIDMALIAHRRHRCRHGAQMHRYVLGLHDHLPVHVEEGRGGIAALLDVR
jgi:hypothetical protein